MANGKYDLIRKLHQFQVGSCVEHGTLQELAISAIVRGYEVYGCHWIKSMPCIPKNLRQEICKRLMYMGVLDNELFDLSLDTKRIVWDLRSIRENFTDGSCKVLSKVKGLEILRLSHPSCSAEAMRLMVQNFPNLRLLEIINTKKVDDSVIEVVASSCPSLEVLNVKSTNITDASMLSLSKADLKLIELNISYTTVTPAGIPPLLNSPMKDTMQLFHFNRCPFLGGALIIRDIVVGFPNLKDYSFDFFRDEDEDEIDWALNQLPGPQPGQNVFFNIPM